MVRGWREVILFRVRARRSLFAAAVLAAPLVATGPARPQQAEVGEQVPRFPAGVELVLIDALVLDGSGNPVEGLRAEDFVLKEEGREQAISTFEAVSLAESPEAPSRFGSRVAVNLGPPPRAERSYTIVFDEMNIAPERGESARRAVQEFVDRLRDGDQVTLVSTTGGAWWTARLPEGKPDLEVVLGRLEGRRPREGSAGRISDVEAMQIHYGREPQILAQVARRWFENGLLTELPRNDARSQLDIDPGLSVIRHAASEVYRNATHRTDATLETVERVAASLAGVRGRKTVFLVTDGFVHDPTRRAFRDLARAARQANAAVYFIDARGLEGTLGQAGQAGAGAEFGRAVQSDDAIGVMTTASREADGARSVALDSGGDVVTGTNNLAEAMSRVARMSRSYYLLGYTSSDPKRDGTFRKIEVRVRRPGLSVRARRGYYAPEDGPGRRRDPESLDPAVRAGLDAPYGGGQLPLRLTAYSFGAGPGKAAVLLVAEVDLAGVELRESAGRFQGALETFVVVTSRETGEQHKNEKLVELSLPPEARERLLARGLPVFRDFQLAPGVYQARLLVRDRASGRLGTVRHEFQVDEPTGLRTSTPVLTDVMEAAGPASPGRPVPVARRIFRGTDRLFLLFEVYGAQAAEGGEPRVVVQYRLRKADGAPVREILPRTLPPGQSGVLAALAAFPLDGLDPGQYEVVATVRDEVGRVGLELREPFDLS